MNNQSKVWVMQILAYTPICLLFALFAFFYSCYMELLNGSYDLNTEQQISAAEAPMALITMQTMTSFMNGLVEKTFAVNDMRHKGIVYAILLHVFVFLFIASALRVIFTDPGRVSDEWHTRAEQDLQKAIDSEKRILKNIRIRTKRQQNRQNLASRMINDLSNGGNIVDGPKDISRDQGSSPFQSIERDSFPIKASDIEFGFIGIGEDNKFDSDPRSDTQEIQGQGGPEEVEDLVEEEDGQNEELIHEREQEHRMNLEGLKINTEDLTHEKIHQYAVVSALKRGNRRFCAHCQKFKPERAHHCRQCGSCVLKMDHHCPWVNNCVGFNNYKYFLNMLFWADTCLVFIAVTFTEVIQDSLMNPEVGWATLYFYLVLYLVSIVLGAILLLFLSFHIWLISNGKSTLEFCEKKTEASYSKGFVRNFVQILGSNFLIWCLPICAEEAEYRCTSRKVEDLYSRFGSIQFASVKAI